MKAERIKNMRFGFDMTQEQFAEKVGVSLPTVRGWEQGKNPPSERHIFKLEKLEKELNK